MARYTQNWRLRHQQQRVADPEFQTDLLAGQTGVPSSGDDIASLPESLADQSRAFEEAAQAAERSGGCSTSEGAPFGSETGNLKDWADKGKQLVTDSVFRSLVVISDSTSEHKVFYRQPDGRAVKRTWAGVFGQIPVPLKGKLDRKNASPSEYLRRMSLQIQVFASDIKLEGVSVSEGPSMIIGQPAGEPSIVISQQWFQKSGAASTEAIAAYLSEEGFIEVPGAYYGWFRPADGVVIVDAKPDNFILTRAGLVPIDLQMAVFSADQMAAAGLLHLCPQSGEEKRIITQS